MTDQDPNPSAGPSRGIPRVAVLTGAGISVDSGVPTLDEEVVRQLLGLDALELAGVNAWEELASVSGWEAHPERVWAWYVWLHHMLTYIEPNDEHRAIAAWQEIAEVTVITQTLEQFPRARCQSPRQQSDTGPLKGLFNDATTCFGAKD